MIQQQYKIKAPMKAVWRALVEPDLIKKWSGAEAKMDARAGGKFRLWDGDIWGTNTFIAEPYHLEQDWFGGKWKHPSKVCMALIPDGNRTIVALCHGDIPEGEKDFADGWKSYYFEPLKKLLES